MAVVAWCLWVYGVMLTVGVAGTVYLCWRVGYWPVDVLGLAVVLLGMGWWLVSRL